MRSATTSFWHTDAVGGRPPQQGLGAPRNTPVEIIDKLNREINAGLANPRIRARIADLGNTPLALSPSDYGKLLAEETEKWAKVIKSSGTRQN